MENLYAIYSYQLVKTNDEGDWTQGVYHATHQAHSGRGEGDLET